MRHNGVVSLRRKLLAGFGIVCLLVAAMLFTGHQFIAKSGERMEQSLRSEVQPLARLNRLESRIRQLRVLEIELPRLVDFFAVRSQLDLLNRATQAFSAELTQFIASSGEVGNLLALTDAWTRYQAELGAVSERASAMDMKRVEAISTFESAQHFSRIAQALEELSANTERQAQAARDKAISYLERQRQALLLISGLGLLLIAASFFWFARSLVLRVSLLRAAAGRIADGEPNVDIVLPGRDELSELSQAFEAMRHKIADREQRFRDIADSSSDWIWETDAELRFCYFSERAAELLGRSLGSLLGTTHEQLMGQGVSGALPENYRAHLADLQAHRPFRAFEYSLRGLDGSFRQIRVSGKPIIGSDGRFLGYRGTGTDITNLLLAQQELIGSEKLAALGGMVAGIAHEINTPIGVGVTAASFLHEQTKAFERLYASGQIKRSEMVAYLRTALEATEALNTNLQRAASLIRSFKQVAVDQSSEERRRFNLRAYIGEIIDSLRPRLKHTQHVIDVDCADNIELDSYPGAFSQILTNLIMNSLIHGFASQAAGRITILAQLGDGELCLRYTDDGCGMSQAQAARVFEPFFTTRRDRGGSGLGMHISHNLVLQKLKGTITCGSTLGAGVEFIIRVPHCLRPAPPDAATGNSS